MSEYLKELDKRIKILKNSYRGQNDWRKAKFEIQKRGGKWRAENGLTYLLKDNVIYVYYSEKGSSKMSIIAYDAPIPYTAEFDLDRMSTQPGKPGISLEELNKECEKQVKTEPKIEKSNTDIIIIVEKDWLSKISKKRWGTINWKHHLKPTKMTLNSPKRIGKRFNPDLIYPGDSFEVIR